MICSDEPGIHAAAKKWIPGLRASRNDEAEAE
jgi:hypothetical protein